MQNPKLICPSSKKMLGFFEKGKFVYEDESSLYSSVYKPIKGVPNMRGELGEEEKIDFLDEARSLP